MDAPVVIVNYITKTIPDIGEMTEEASKDPLDKILLVIRSKDGFDIAYVMKSGRIIVDYDSADIEMYSAIVTGVKKGLDEGILEKAIFRYLKTVFGTEPEIKITVDDETIKEILNDFSENLLRELEYFEKIIESHVQKKNSNFDVDSLIASLTQELDDDCLVKVISIINQKIYK